MKHEDESMDLLTEMLAPAHEADIQRAARARRLQTLVTTCRRRLLGVLPFGQTREPCTT
ncbi:MAG: hypothetical protein M3Q38_01625 [Chloroflexota bacterium]|nr:hypothetical protein [Chloroflexota bacterium]